MGSRPYRRVVARIRRRLVLAGTLPPDAQPSPITASFIERCQRLEAPTVLELGTKRTSEDTSTVRQGWVPGAKRFIGVDVEAGPDVDVVADVHRLSRVIGEEQVDVIIACSVFEHLKYPPLAAHEIMNTLKIGGLLYVQTHQSFPLHNYPADYFRFSREALASLFGASMGFEVMETAYDFPVLLYSRWNAHLQQAPAFLNSLLWGKKNSHTPADYVYEL